MERTTSKFSAARFRDLDLSHARLRAITTRANPSACSAARLAPVQDWFAGRLTGYASAMGWARCACSSESSERCGWCNRIGSKVQPLDAGASSFGDALALAHASGKLRGGARGAGGAVVGEPGVSAPMNDAALSMQSPQRQGLAGLLICGGWTMVLDGVDSSHLRAFSTPSSARGHAAALIPFTRREDRCPLRVSAMLRCCIGLSSPSNAAYGDGLPPKVSAARSRDYFAVRRNWMEMFALHPAMTNLYQRYREKELIAFHAVASAISRTPSLRWTKILLESGTAELKGA